MLHPALQCYLRAIELDPEQSKIWCNLGALQFQLGEFQHSVDSLNRAVGPQARLRAGLGQPRRLALRARPARRGGALLPPRAQLQARLRDPSFKLGTIYFQEGRMEDAEKAFARCWRSTRAIRWRATTSPWCSRGPTASTRRSRFASARPPPPGETELPSLAWNEMAFQLYEQSRFAEAIRAYEKALTFTPERAVIWLDAGVAHQQLGHLDQARRHYEQAVELEPELAPRLAQPGRHSRGARRRQGRPGGPRRSGALAEPSGGSRVIPGAWERRRKSGSAGGSDLQRRTKFKIFRNDQFEIPSVVLVAGRKNRSLRRHPDADERRRDGIRSNMPI